MQSYTWSSVVLARGPQARHGTPRFSRALAVAGLTVVAVGFAAPIFPQAADPSRYSWHPAHQTNDTVIVDARWLQSVQRSFKSTQRVDFILSNTNPFLYRYQLAVRHYPVAETAALDFFKSGFGVSLDPLKPAAAQDTKPIGSCTNSTAKWTAALFALGIADDDADAAQIAAHAKNDPVVAESRRLDGNREKLVATLTTPNAADVRLYNTGVELKNLLNDYQTYLDDSKILTPLKTVDNTFADKIRSYSSTVASAKADTPTECGNVLADYSKRLATFAADTLAVRAAYDALVAAKASAAKLSASTTAILNEPANFYQVVHLGGYEGPMVDSVDIQRQAAAATDQVFKTVSVIAIRFGDRPHLSIGAGVVWAYLPVNGYSPVTRKLTPLSAKPSDTLATVVGVSADSKGRVSPMLVLSTRIFDLRALLKTDELSGVDVLVGATIRKDQTTAAEFYVGPALGLFNDWVYLSGGAYIGSVTQLSAINIGDLLPNGSAPVPTTTRLGVAFGAMISFKLR